MVCVQKEISRGVLVAVQPTEDLNHCRASSTRLMRASGAWQMDAASVVSSSNASSAGVSRISSERRAASLAASFLGKGNVILLILVDALSDRTDLEPIRISGLSL